MSEEIDIESIEGKSTVVLYQVLMIVIVAFTFLLWWILEHFNPDFFNFPYWHTTQNLVGSLLVFWPLYLWAAACAIISCFNIKHLFNAKTHLALSSITSIFAGLWEELGYRCVFILIAMINIWLSNIIWFWLILIAFIILTAFIMTKLDNWLLIIASGIVSLIIIIMFWNSGFHDPVYWIYQNIIFPLFSWVSIGKLDPILYHSTAPFLFIAGAVSANANFRNGHKYQGIVGFLNAWIVGFVLLHAMLFHGLIVAILIHAIYDLEFAVIRFVGRLVKS